MISCFCSLECWAFITHFVDCCAKVLSEKMLTEHAMMEPECAKKCRDIFRAIYAKATICVRVTASDGEKIHSEHFPIRRGVVQGDIFYPLCFIIALCVLLERFCAVPDDCAVGIFGLMIKSLEYADDAALIDHTAEKSTERINRFTEAQLRLLTWWCQ